MGGVKQVYALGARDYFFKNPIKAWFVTTLMSVIPCSRRGFSRYEVDILKMVADASSSDVPAAVVIFPEGTRSRTGKLQRFKDGVGYLSLKLGIPVVPAYVDGTFAALPKGRTIPHWFDRTGRISFHVRFGSPLAPPKVASPSSIASHTERSAHAQAPTGDGPSLIVTNVEPPATAEVGETRKRALQVCSEQLLSF